jgi:hypothetical protein
MGLSMPMIPRASSIFAGNVCSNHVATRKILKNGWNRERGFENPEQRLGIEFVSRNGARNEKPGSFVGRSRRQVPSGWVISQIPFR